MGIDGAPGMQVEIYINYHVKKERLLTTGEVRFVLVETSTLEKLVGTFVAVTGTTRHSSHLAAKRKWCHRSSPFLGPSGKCQGIRYTCSYRFFGVEVLTKKI